MNTATRVKEAAMLFTRYGEVVDDRLLDVLELLTDINNDMHRGRDKAVVEQSVGDAVELLHDLANSYAP